MAETKTEAAADAAPAAAGSLLDEILAESKVKPSDEGYDVARKGVEAFVAELLRDKKTAKIDRTAVDAMIAEIDRKLSAQVNEILHHPDVQKLEAAWRGLKFTIDHIDFRENIRVELLSVDKATLQADLDDAPDLTKSGFYRIAYTNEYGVLGGKPFGVMNMNYDFGPGPMDVELLRKVAAVGSMAHCPVLSNVNPEFFGRNTFRELTTLKDLNSLFEGPQYARWRGFRQSEDARYVGLCVPRFLLRLPYGEKNVPVKAFNFEEDVIDHHDRYLWGYASNALVTRIAESFAKFRWSPNIIGPQSGGTIDALPLHQYEAMGEIQTKIPTETMIPDRLELELSEQGFIPMIYRKESDNACFMSANSTQMPKFFGNSAEGKAAETNFRLGTQLPYMFVITRLAHYIKVLQREQIGSWKDKATLQRELNDWISQYVSDMDDPAPGVRSVRPLRQAQITVEDVEGQPGWYRCGLKVRPHFKYMGASFTLSLVGKLDKE
jgi:type VI secretion system protein ImpC